MYSGFLFSIRPANGTAKSTGFGICAKGVRGRRQSRPNNVHGQR